MAVETLTQFPDSFVAGDTLRVTLSDADYPSSLWTLQVFLRGASIKSFSADSVDDDEYELVIPASDTAKLIPGVYSVSYVYTETSSDERATVEIDRKIQIFTDPNKTAEKTTARKTLEAMESALLKLAAGSNSTVNFNGQSFTKKNLKELQDAIDRERSIVAAEESKINLVSGGRTSSIFIRFGRNFCSE